MILGTAAYMAPEQARGRPVDKRADIWAFGVVLYELLTGRGPFHGEDITELVASVVKEKPDLSGVPSQVRRLLAKCLEKDPNKRLRDIGDLELLLLETPAPAAAIASPQSSPLPWIAATGVLAVALGVALWAPWRVEKAIERPLVRLDVDLGEGVSLSGLTSGASTDGSSGASSVAISPDGARLVYVSGTPTRLFTRRLDQPRATELPGTSGAYYPFFSPDGQWVGFCTAGGLNKISVEGGAVLPLGDLSANPLRAGSFTGASWGEDGGIVASEPLRRGLLRFAAAGGPPQTLAGLGKRELGLGHPQILPGGKAILFSAFAEQFDVDRYTIEVLTLADGHRKIVARGGTSARYVAAPGRPGHLIYVNKASMFAVPFDLDKLETRGTAVPVLDDVAYSARPGTGQFDVSRGPDGHGVLVYRRAGADTSAMLTLEWVDAAGKREPLPAKPAIYWDPRVSPDGKRVALAVGEGRNIDVWVYDPQRDAMTRLTSLGGISRFPTWSPDGQYVVFFSSNTKGILQARADGASQPQALIESNVSNVLHWPWSFSPDGKRLAYYVAQGGERMQIWTVPMEEQSPLASKGGQLKAGKEEQFLQSGFNDRGPSFSPDGRWLAYQSSESGKYEVYVRAFPPSAGPGVKWQISNSGGTDPRWSRKGHDLLYRSGDQIMAVSYTVKGNTFLGEKPRVWIAKLGGTGPGWDLAPDGKRALVAARGESEEAPKAEHEVVFLDNFFDYLRQKAPVK